MKKKILLMLTLLAGVMTANAADGVTISNATVLPNGKGQIFINLTNESNTFTGFQFVVTLPTGLSFGDPISVKGPRLDATHSVGESVSGQSCQFTCFSSKNINFTGTSGAILQVNVQADETVTEGAELSASISNIIFAISGSEQKEFADANFDIACSNTINFDENSFLLPNYDAGITANVHMVRTIKANEWSTIVLPFRLSKAQAEAAFGSDVELAQFKDYEVTFEDPDHEIFVTTGLKLNFEKYSLGPLKPMREGVTYLIKTSKDITSIDASNVSNWATAVTETSTKDKEYELPGKLTGKFIPSTIPANGLFISDNQFWYSTGATNTKAFRCWFELGAVLNESAVSRTMLVFDGETTGIDNVTRNTLENGKIYNLQGVEVKTPSKGVYIVNGKKVVIK